MERTCTQKKSGDMDPAPNSVTRYNPSQDINSGLHLQLFNEHLDWIMSQGLSNSKIH